MSATAGAGVNERLARLTELGVSIWIDEIRRSLIESGELARLRDELSLRGETSNPAIFEKAILGGDEYDEFIGELAREGKDATEIYLAIAVRDVQDACDVLRPVWDEAGGADGFVSLEVEPSLAHDTDATLASARELWKRVDRPNVMIKIPGTEEGIPAIEEATADGINVNVTLLFGLERYERVIDAYVSGLEERLAARSIDQANCGGRGSACGCRPRITSGMVTAAIPDSGVTGASSWAPSVGIQEQAIMQSMLLMGDPSFRSS